MVMAVIIGSMQYTLSEFCKNLNIYIISFEYPSYGLCTAPSPNQDTINTHADRTFNFVRDTLQWPVERIIIYGHSIGSGAACYLASTQTIAALILQSPYTAIKNLVREKAGVFSFLIDSRSWDNLQAMKDIICPILFIHGQADTLIPSDHSQILHDSCTHIEGKKLVLLRHEDHNSMSEATLLKYITPFMTKQYELSDRNLRLPVVKIDKQLREQPSNVPETTSSSGGILYSIASISRASTAATMSVVRTISGKQTDEPNDNE